MTRMQVKVNIHESLIKKIKDGQKAEVRIDAFPNVVFVGTVKSVSQLADSTRPWMTGGVKEYPTIVTLDDLIGHELKPGMTAEAKILVGSSRTCWSCRSRPSPSTRENSSPSSKGPVAISRRR